MKIRLLIVTLGILLGWSAKAVFPIAETAAPSGGANPPRAEAAPPDSTDSALSPPGSRVDGDVAE